MRIIKPNYLLKIVSPNRIGIEHALRLDVEFLVRGSKVRANRKQSYDD